MGNSGRRSLWIALNVCLAPSDRKKDRSVAIQGAEVAACHRNVSKLCSHSEIFLLCAMINGLWLSHHANSGGEGREGLAFFFVSRISWRGRCNANLL